MLPRLTVHPFRHPFLAVLAVLGGFVSLGLAVSAQRLSADPPPHILLVLLDDLGYGDPVCFNPNSKIETPTLDDLAADGLRLTDAHAPGALCHLSRYGLMTGVYPHRANIGVWPKHAVIQPGQTTIASLLKSAGYRTAMVGKWHLGFEENGYEQPLPGGPVDVGFDTFFGIRASTDIPPYFYIRGDRAVQPPTLPILANQTPGWSPIQGAFWRAGEISPDLTLEDVLPNLTEEALGVIDDVAETGRDLGKTDPLFLYVALPAPHTPWLPSEVYQKASNVDLYGDFVMMVDAMVGRLVDRLSEWNLDDNTLVIVTSDNGPTWLDMDRERFSHDSAGGWRGMKSDAWEAGHRMPTLVRWPGKIAAGRVSDQLVCFTDLLATFADLTDQSLPANEKFDSVSFLPTLLDQPYAEGAARQTLVTLSGSGLKAVRDGQWKWINGLGSGGFTKPSKVPPTPGGPTSQLYHLGDDPTEQTNLALDQPDRVAQMRAILDAEK